MKCAGRLLAVLFVCILLSGCAANVYREGVESLQAGDYDAAIEQLTEAVEKERNVADSYRGIGLAYWEKGDYNAAVQGFESALENGAKETGAIYNLLGACKMKLEDYNGAIEAYEKGITEEDSTEEMIQEMRFNVIVSYEKLEEWDTVKARLDEYILAYPDDEQAQKEIDFLKTR